MIEMETIISDDSSVIKEENIKSSNVQNAKGSENVSLVEDSLSNNSYMQLFASTSIATLSFPFENLPCIYLGYMVALLVFFLTLALVIAPFLDIVDEVNKSRVRFLNTKKELLAMLIMTSISLSTVILVNYSQLKYAVDYENSREPVIVNGNLYYSSWAAFALSFHSLLNNIRRMYGLPCQRRLDHVDDFLSDNEICIIQARRRVSTWGWLFIFSVVVVCSAVAIYINECIDDEMKASTSELEGFCYKNNIAFANGTITLVLTVGVLCTKFDLEQGELFPLWIERIFSFSVLIMNSYSIWIATYNHGVC